MITLFIATRNAHKVQEIAAILGSGFQYMTLKDFPNAPEVVEDAGTFAGNAMKKALELAKWVAGAKSEVRSPKSEVKGLARDPRTAREGLVLADDSGLEVDALGGAPGVHSARFAALDSGEQGNSTASENNTKLLRLLEQVPLEKRAARFRCVLAVTPVVLVGEANASAVCSATRAELRTQLFEGTCEGRIGFQLRGKGGFGYDPLFFPAGYEQTFGELGEEVKNRLSHRAKALEKLKSSLS